MYGTVFKINLSNKKQPKMISEMLKTIRWNSENDVKTIIIDL